MRQRGVKNREEIIEACRDWMVDDPAALRGKWSELFGNDAPIRLEIGSGKGRFIASLAEKHPDRSFIACEGGTNIFIRILQKAAERQLTNLKVIPSYINDASQIFGDGELDGIYIDFCDPWPKDRHAKRRLTHRKHIAEYQKVIRRGGVLLLRTDNEALWEFSVEEMRSCGLEPVTSDAACEDGEILTEYEEKFIGCGKRIYYVRTEMRK